MKDAGVTAKDIDEVVLVGGQTRMPKAQEQVTQLFGKEPHKGVNPDEVVAVGAAIQGAVLTGDVKGVVLLDVTPLSLGVETLGGAATPLVTRNTTIPARKSELFSTAADNQDSVEIHVVQGERPLARDNRTLGRFHLTGIAPAPRGMPQIEVSFDIDANGILTVSAKDQATGKQQQIVITASSGLSKQDVDRMVKEAESNAADDARRREEIELRNQVDTVLYQTERELNERGAHLTDEERRTIQQQIAEAREAMRGDDQGRLTRARDGLTQAARTLSEAASRQATGGGPSSSQPGSSTPPGVVDAELVDSDDRKT
jgi:molecular chaperone DnaK